MHMITKYSIALNPSMQWHSCTQCASWRTSNISPLSLIQEVDSYHSMIVVGSHAKVFHVLSKIQVCLNLIHYPI